jgi:hypothetical protein
MIDQEEGEPRFTQWLQTSRVAWVLQAMMLGAAPWGLELLMGWYSNWQ